MSLNLLNTTAARMAFFLVGSWAIAAGETEKPSHETLYVLNPKDREILAWDTLAIIAEAQGGFVSEEDIVEAAWHWAIDSDEIPAMATDLWHALRDCQ